MIESNERSATFRPLNPRDVYDPAAYGMSQGAIDLASGLVFVSGQVAWDTQGKVGAASHAGQTALALDNLTRVLAAAGCTREHVISVRVYVRGELAEHMPAVVPALASYFGATRPALTGIGVASLATRETLIEIEAIARVPRAA